MSLPRLGHGHTALLATCCTQTPSVSSTHTHTLLTAQPSLVRANMSMGVTVHGFHYIVNNCSLLHYVNVHYMRHNNDVQTFRHLLLLFSWHKRGTYIRNCSYFKVTLLVYRNCIIVNGCYWNTCKLVFTNSLYMANWTRSRINAK